MELREAWAALRNGWWVCLIGLLVGASVSLGNSLVTTPLYTAQLQLFVSTPNSSESATEALQGSQFSEQRVTSYAQLITGDALARSVIDELGLDLTPGELVDQVTASGVTDTVLIDVSVSDASPEQALAIAQAIGDLFPDQVDQLEESGADGESLVNVTVVQQAELPTDPSSPQTARDIGMGALVGLVAGAGIAVGWLGRRRAATRPAQLEEVSGVPVLAVVPRPAAGASSAASTDAFRRAALDMLPLRTATTGRVVVVTSTSPGPAGSTAATGLARAFAETGRRVTLVDADLTTGAVTEEWGGTGADGLAELLAGTAEVADVVRSTSLPGLSVVPTGRPTPTSRQLLLSTAVRDLIAPLVAGQDVVVVDAAALFPAADALGLVSVADDVLLTVVDGRTRIEEVAQARRTLEQLGAPLSGVVLAPARRRRRTPAAVTAEEPVAVEQPAAVEEPAAVAVTRPPVPAPAGTGWPTGAGSTAARGPAGGTPRSGNAPRPGEATRRREVARGPR